MKSEKGYLVDVGMKDLPFPIKVASKVDTGGQSTIANISITARIMHEFETRWINKFINIAHQHRERIGTKTLLNNIIDYRDELNASMVKIDFAYPFFVEKSTPVSKQKCLVRYFCTYSAKTSTVGKTKILFKINIPVITTYPIELENIKRGQFGQLSVVTVEVELTNEIYPEDLVAIVDKHALAPLYSFLSDKDEAFIIEKIHSEERSSVIMVNKIKEELTQLPDIEWFSVRCSNHGMIHSYSTVIGTEKSMWVPDMSFDEETYGTGGI